MEKESYVAEPQSAYSAEESYKEPLVDPRFERIFGTEYAMSSPSYKHQGVLLAIGSQLKEQLSKHECMPIVAPFDVYVLYDEGDEDSVVQPDIFLACDKTKLKSNCYIGAPKFIIEVLSSNRSHDMVMKLNLYEKAGVSEYWIIDPEEQIITVLTLSDNGYITHNYSGKNIVQLTTIPGCAIDFKKVFEGL